MSEMELYGLMAIAKVHQAAVAGALKELESVTHTMQAAAENFDQVRAVLQTELQEAAVAAFREAVATECQQRAAALLKAAEKVTEAAAATRAAANAVNWLWVAAALIVGVGLGWAGQWFFVGKDLQAIQAFTAATDEQTLPSEPAKAMGK